MRKTAKSEAVQTENEFCSTRDAADLLSVSIKTAQAWVESGVLQAWKTPGGHRRIRRESVQMLLQERTQSTSTAKATPSDGRLTVLTVDDDPQMQELYALQIEGWGLPLRQIVADNGFDALLLIGERAPDILIIDLQMPGMDGFRMLEALRKSHLQGKLQIIVVSGLGVAEIRDRGGVPDGIELFTKPVAFDRLQRHVRSLIAQSKCRLAGNTEVA